MLKSYPLQKNNEYSFEFVTNEGIKYHIYFLDYSFMFTEYTHIKCPVYSFNIDAIEGNPAETIGDNLVGATISNVLNLFFKRVNNVAVYVCDSLDQRQFARKRKFDIWFYLYSNGTIVKEDGLTIIEGVEIYNSILIHKNNQHLTDLIFAFKELNERTGSK